MNSSESMSRRSMLTALGAGIGAAAMAAPGAQAQSAPWPPIASVQTGVWVRGRWVWGDLFTDDLAAAQRFYGAVFGWSFEVTSALDGRYVVASAADEMVAGLIPRQRRRPAEPGGRWVPFMSVPDPQAAVRDVEAGGGRTLVAPATLPGRGIVALFADPEGVVFGVIHADGGDPDDYVAELNEWIWLELWAHAPDRAAAFYTPLGGYTVEQLVDDSGRSYLQLASGGYGRATIRQTPFPKLPPVWIPFVRVSEAAGAVDRVRAAGGRVVVAPRPDLLDGRVAVCLDPGGAPFGVLAHTE